MSWTLDPESFDRLLVRLGEDREKAGRRFEELRRQLILWFTYERASEPEQCADTVLDRVAKRLSEGEHIENLSAYARGVAKRILQESQLAEQKASRALGAIPGTEAEPEETERDLACLEQCLGRLPAESRSLVERYYRAENRTLIPGRKRLADELAISPEALRNRALRLRKRLEKCMVACRQRRNAE